MHKHADLREALRTRRVRFAGRKVKAHSKKGTMSAMQFTLTAFDCSSFKNGIRGNSANIKIKNCYFTAYFVLMASMFGLAEAACDVRDNYYAY